MGRRRHFTAIKVVTLAAAAATTLVALLSATAVAGTHKTAAESTTVVIWDFLDQPNLNQKANNRIDALYMKQHPGVKIDRKFVPSDAFWPKVQAAIAAKNGPDIITMYPGRAAKEYEKGLLPLDNLLTAQQRRDWNFLTQAKTDGKLLAVPFTAYAYAMEYNKAMFAKVGLNPSKALSTWANLLDACEKLSESGVTPIGSGFKDGVYGEWIMYVIGSQLFSKKDIGKQNAGKVPWTDNRYRSALNRILELKEANCFSADPQTRTMEDGFDEFYNGKAALYFGAGVREDKIARLGGVSKVGYTTPPKVPDSVYKRPMTDSLWGAGFSITNWSKNKKAAWSFLSFYLGARASEIITNLDPSQLPSNRAARPNLSRPIDRELVRISQLPDNQSIYVGFTTAEITLLKRLMPEVVTGRLKVDDLLSRLEKVRQREAKG